MEDKLVSFLTNIFGAPKSQSKGEYLFWSPFINHRKRKLNVNLDPNRDEFGYWQDWVSEESGKSLFTLLKRSGNKSKMSGLSRLLGNRSFSSSRSEPRQKKEDSAPSVTLPEEFKSFKDHSKSFQYKLAYNFLKRRGLCLTDILRYNLGYCPRGKFSGRVIIPSYDSKNRLNYFVARAFSDSYLKYMNPAAPKNIIGFENFISWDNPVVLTEGVFDAIAIRRNAIPLLGKKISQKLRDTIIREMPPKVYLCLDNDAIKDAGEQAKYLIDQGVSVNIVEMPEAKDPSDLGFKKIWELIKESKPTEFKDLVRYKISL